MTGLHRVSKSKLSARPGGRAPGFSVDTNILSYDRKDPFAAFNVLLRLLGSLPSRMGGCQYKLYPEEHKLTMHLLAIIEPFVGVSHSKRTLTQQPTEVLDAIIFHIDEKRDLLNLSLSCHRLYDVVGPRHLDYRVIKCKASAVSVWNHFIVHRSLARNVRVLTVLDERSTESPVIPRDIGLRDTDLESTDDELGMHAKQERFIVSALSKMTALRSFTWCCNHSLVSLDAIWPILGKCQSLEEADIRENLIFAPLPDESAGQSAAKRHWVLPELRSMNFQSTKHTYGAVKHPNLTRVSSMLAYAPNIKSVSISYDSQRSSGRIPAADSLLLVSRYSSLTCLSLTNLFLSSSYASSLFLEAHPKLETLRLNVYGTGSKALDLSAGCLPNLRELDANRDLATSILRVASSLETLKGVALSGTYSHADESFFQVLRSSGGNLKRLELAREGWTDLAAIRRLVACTPGLRWLDVGPSRKTGAAKAAPTVATNAVEWAGVLSMMPELLTFHGVKFFFDVPMLPGGTSISVAGQPGHRSESVVGPSDRSRIRKNEEVAGILGRRCPKLRRVDHWDEDGTRVIVLLRDHGEKEKNGRVRWDVRKLRV